MCKIISVFNQKGGIGKSTTSVNLGAALAVKDKKVLLVDMDPQANTTVSVGLSDEELESTVYDLLKAKKVTENLLFKVIRETEFENLDVLPSDITLSDAEITLANSLSRETILSKVLEKIREHYDYIIIDCPPSLGLLSINSLVASDGVLIPIATSYFSVKGIKHLLDTITLVQENLKPKLQIIGVLITKFDKRKNISKDIREQLKSAFGEKIYDVVIRVNSKIEYAQDNQVPVIHYDKSCNGYIDYMNLAKEVLEYEW